jgi:predicted metal-binding membrane protein
MTDVTYSADTLPCVMAARPASGRASQHAFLGVAALLLVASATATILWNSSMPGLSGLPMPGGWMLSMPWAPSCGRSWLRSTASFLGMWVVMTVAMMLPSLVPMLQRYRQAVGRAGEARLELLTALVGAGYFTVWTLAGLAAFVLGSALTAAALHLPLLARAVPVATGFVVLIAGALQLSAWKAHHLACCRAAPGRFLPADVATAWRHGVHLGLHCLYCSAGPTAILLVLGVMDLRVMAIVTAATTLERLAPSGKRAAQAIGAIALGVGLFLVAQAVGLG